MRILSAKRTALAQASGSKFKPDMPVVVVYENGRRTPGQWYADTIANSQSTQIAIDFGAGWTLTEQETASLIDFAKSVVAGLES